MHLQRSLCIHVQSALPDGQQLPAVFGEKGREVHGIIIRADAKGFFLVVEEFFGICGIIIRVGVKASFVLGAKAWKVCLPGVDAPGMHTVLHHAFPFA